MPKTRPPTEHHPDTVLPAHSVSAPQMSPSRRAALPVRLSSIFASRSALGRVYVFISGAVCDGLGNTRWLSRCIVTITVSETLRNATSHVDSRRTLCPTIGNRTALHIEETFLVPNDSGPKANAALGDTHYYSRGHGGADMRPCTEAQRNSSALHFIRGGFLAPLMASGTMTLACGNEANCHLYDSGVVLTCRLLLDFSTV